MLGLTGHVPVPQYERRACHIAVEGQTVYLDPLQLPCRACFFMRGSSSKGEFIEYLGHQGLG